ncbi:glycosyl transferase [Falsiroseomonas bella]|uniref:Glycosyl transferase n=1 Tax=Falsiroseomonas bella TaxID=2184016 RepID=A0A317FJ61_9PROT|nr:glycosyltransferase family 2 protein [Falsiroseomonas bella]PWS38653.1 glycosyl transferase [Falsiroseomonas bella]
MPRSRPPEARFARLRPVVWAAARALARVPWALHGLLAFTLGLAMYFLGVLMVFPRYLLGLDAWLLPVSEWLVWYSGVPLVAGLALIAGDLLLLLGSRRRGEAVRWDALEDPRVTVALTAYNDELSIGDAVRDFRAHPRVARVIVVSNNSRDATMARAAEAGAIVFDEPLQGYGRCVHRCLSEAILHGDAELVVLCEGDGTFRAFDIDKLLAYAPHADIVNGTRTVERLRQPRTQLTTFMYYGNLFVGKLLEAKHVGRGTITDVGTTYKLCRRDALRRLLPSLNPDINLEFNAHFLDTTLGAGLTLVECPITFHPRIGDSKGGNASDLRALKVGLRMMSGIILGWRKSGA